MHRTSCVVVMLSSWYISLVADAATLEDVYNTARASTYIHLDTVVLLC